MKRVTITTLARELGLSVCTINKAMYGKPRISEETRRRVLAAAERLGYRPNRLARALSRNPFAVGVVYPGAWPSHFGVLVDGARKGFDELRDHNFAATYRSCPSFTDGRAFAREVTAALGSGPSGLILSFGYARVAEYRKIAETIAVAGVPCVLLGGDVPGMPRLTVVWHDTRRCGAMAAEVLNWLTPGSPVAMLVGRFDSVDHTNKIAAFRAEAARFGLPVVTVVETLDDPEAGYPVTARLLAEHPEVKGIYVSSENGAGTGRYLAATGLAGRIKVVATGIGSEIQHFIEAGVFSCTLYQNQFQQGRRAVQTLYRFLESGVRPAPEILVPPVLVQRATLDLYRGEL